jgi:Integrase core domain
MRIFADWVSNAYYININIDYNRLEAIIYRINPVLDSSSLNSTQLDLYHKRLLHINKDYILKTIDNVSGLKTINSTQSLLHDCESCYYRKFSRTYNKEPLKSRDILQVIDLDIAGPFKTIGLKGERYFLTITCRASRAIWVYPIKAKSEAIDVLIKFYNLILTQFDIKILNIRLDNAKEFKSGKWTLYCDSKGIICEYTSPYTPNQNGISERLNRFIIERLISICSKKNIPLKLWPYLV